MSSTTAQGEDESLVDDTSELETTAATQPATAEPDAPDDSVSSVSTVPVPPPPTVPPEPQTLLVVCDGRDGFTLQYIDAETGETVRSGGIANTSDLTNNTYLNGRQVETMPPFYAIACGHGSTRMADRTIWNNDFTSLAGIQERSDADVVLRFDTDSGSIVTFVEPEGESDFGGAPASALAATFMPDGQRIIWQEYKDQICRTYIAPADGIVSRDAIADHFVGETDRCGNVGSTRFSFVGDQALVCVNTGCYDAATNVKFEGDIPSRHPPEPEVPPSARFDIESAEQSADGRVFFVAEDDDNFTAYLYSWDGTGDPIELTTLGPTGDLHRIIGVVEPQATVPDPSATTPPVTSQPATAAESSSTAAAAETTTWTSETAKALYPTYGEWQTTTGGLSCPAFPSPQPESSIWGTDEDQTSGLSIDIHFSNADAQAAFDSMRAWFEAAAADPSVCGGAISDADWTMSTGTTTDALVTWTYTLPSGRELPGQMGVYMVCGNMLLYAEGQAYLLGGCPLRSPEG